MLVLKGLVMVGMLGLVIVGMIRVLARSGKVVNASEVTALQSVTKYANSVVGEDDPRKYYLRLMHFKLIGYVVNAPFVLVEPEELAVLAPFIDDCLRQNSALSGHATPQTTALEAFRRRMIQKGGWPRGNLPQAQVSAIPKGST